MSRKREVEGDSGAQKRVPVPWPETVGDNKKTSTPGSRENSRWLSNRYDVRIFTVMLMMSRWRRLCIKFFGSVMIERAIHGNRSHIYRDMIVMVNRSRNQMKNWETGGWPSVWDRIKRSTCSQKRSQAYCPVTSIPYENTLLMEGTQYPTSNLVMPQVHQMIIGFQMPKIKIQDHVWNRVSLCCSWKTVWYSQEKHHGQNARKHTGWWETGWRGGVCHMGWLSGLSLVCFICELTFCKRFHTSLSLIIKW
jgi:hypothetical protein